MSLVMELLIARTAFRALSRVVNGASAVPGLLSFPVVLTEKSGPGFGVGNGLGEGEGLGDGPGVGDGVA